MKKRAHMLCVLAVLCSALMLSGCGKATGPEPNTLRVNLGTEPPSLDWHQATDSVSFDVLNNIMIGLLQYDEQLNVVPAVAEKWDALENGKKYIFHLRKDVKWTDGRPVVAGDFEYGWKRLLNPDTAGPYAFFLYPVKNAEPYNTGKIKDPNLVGVRALDDSTLEVELEQPAAYFLYLTAYGPCYPARKDLVEKFGNRWSEPPNLVTDGPFSLKTWEHEYKIELESNPTFFEGQPKLKHIKMFMVPEPATAFALYENNELDYVDNRSFSTPDIERYHNSPEYTQFPVLRNIYVGFNCTKPPFTNPLVRKAVSLVLDRSLFPLVLKRGQMPLYTWIPPQLPGYSKDNAAEYNPELGRKLLAQAGYPGGKGFPPLEMLFPYQGETSTNAQTIQDILKRELSINVSLKNTEFKVYLRTLKRDPPPIFAANWGADYPDPETFANLFTSENGNNDLKYSNPKYDQLIHQAEGEQDRAKRISLYQQADHLLVKEDTALAPIYQAAQNMMVKPWVHGISKNAIDIQFFKGVTVEAH